MILNKKIFTLFILLTNFLFGQEDINIEKFDSWSIRTFAIDNTYDNHEIYSEMNVIAGNVNYDKKLYYSLGVWHSSSDDMMEVYTRLEGLGYIHDESPEDKNYLSLEVIFDIDESKRYNVNGQVRQSGFVYISYGEDVEIGKLMRNSNAMWIKNGGVVTKISLDGVSEALNAFLDRWKASEAKENNPFEKTNDQVENPFGNDSK